MRLLSGRIAGLDENTHEARAIAPPTSASASSPIIATSSTAHRRPSTASLKNVGAAFQARWLLDRKRIPARRRRACVEAEFAIVIEEVAVFGQGEKHGSLEDLAISLVHRSYVKNSPASPTTTASSPSVLSQRNPRANSGCTTRKRASSGARESHALKPRACRHPPARL